MSYFWCSDNDDPTCYAFIDPNCHTMQQDTRIAFPKFPGVSYIENILAVSNDDMEGSD